MHTFFHCTKLLLVANNTLIVDEGATLGLNRSTLWLAETSWLKIANASLLALNDSRLNVTNFFTWCALCFVLCEGRLQARAGCALTSC